MPEHEKRDPVYWDEHGWIYCRSKWEGGLDERPGQGRRRRGYLLGGGTRLFNQLDQEIKLRLLGTHSDNGITEFDLSAQTKEGGSFHEH